MFTDYFQSTHLLKWGVGKQSLLNPVRDKRISNTIVLFSPRASMSVEQTDQLIRLILNSLLLVVACVIVLSGSLMRHSAVVNQLRSAQREYFELLEGAGAFRTDRLMQLKFQVRQLRQRYWMAHVSTLTAHYALLFCIASALVIAFRTLINSNWLIHAALVLFVLGMGILLISIGVMLLDFYSSKRSIWDEINWLLNLGTPRQKPPGTIQRSRRSKSPASAQALNKRVVNMGG